MQQKAYFFSKLAQCVCGPIDPPTSKNITNLGHHRPWSIVNYVSWIYTVICLSYRGQNKSLYCSIWLAWLHVVRQLCVPQSSAVAARGGFVTKSLDHWFISLCVCSYSLSLLSIYSLCFIPLLGQLQDRETWGKINYFWNNSDIY